MPSRIHPLSPRHLFLRTSHRRHYRHALLALLVFIACASLLPLAGAVAPYRSPEDYGPSPQARAHQAQCRQQVLQVLVGTIESEDFAARGEQEYFRYVVRKQLREVMFICDAHSGVLRRQIDLWEKVELEGAQGYR